MIAKILETDPPPISSLQPMTPPSLDRVVRRCLAKEPDERWQSANDLTNELKWIAEGGSQAEIAAPVMARRKSRERLAWSVAALLLLGFLGAMVPASRYLRETPPETPGTSSKVSILPPPNAVISSDSAPAMSPDGRRLAFVARDSSGKALIWIRPLDSLTAQPLAGTEDAHQLFWSPDSRFIGFFSQTKLKKVDASGAPPQILCEASLSTLGATWNQDGVIAVARGSAQPIETVPASGGTPKPATTLDGSRQERGHFFPYFLPDGRHFLYVAVSGMRENTGVYVGSLDSKDRKRLLDVQSEVRYASPGFLLFVRDRTLMAERFDASRLELSGEPFPVAEQVASNPIFGDAMFSVSGNGILAYRVGAVSGDTQLMWFGHTGKRLGPVGIPGEYLNQELSPNGQRVAFERKSTHGDRDIWLLELPEGATTRFTFNPADDYYPVWSPDGSQIVFASNREGSFGLYQKPSSGAGNEESLLKSAADVGPYSWSPDRRFITYRSVGAKGFTEAWILPLFGDRKPFPYLQGDFTQSGPRVSPDGHWLAYYSTESGRYEVYIQSFPKRESKWQVSTGGGITPLWARDGKAIFYLALDGKLMSVDINGNSALQVGTPKPLFELRTFGGARTILGFRNQFVVAPDGQRFLANVPVAEDSSSPITLALNWAAGLKK